MKRLLHRLGADRRGLAAVELALVAPVIAGLALLSLEVWSASARSQDMRAALKAGAQYYMNGGANDVTAQALALSAWEAPPGDAEVSITRSCACGEVAQVCTTLCSNGTPPAVIVVLQATGTQAQAFFNPVLSEQRVVRVR